MPINVHPSFAVHPGAWLKTEVVGPSGLSVTGLAQHLHVSRPALSALLNARAGLSGEMAIRFEKAFGLKADTLLRMQAAYELADARTREDQIGVKPLARRAA
jgi:addiction module HigA family antidote